MLKAYNNIEELDKETLMSDDDFVADASAFLRDRGGYEDLMTSDVVFDRFMEHMRFQDSNEVTAIRDLEYAQNTDLEGKQRFGRLMDAYDKVDDLSLRMVGDYAEAIARAPSTYAGIITGGVGKAASIAGTQAVKLGLRKTLSSSLQQAARTAIKEGASQTLVKAGKAAATQATSKSVLKGAAKAAAVEGTIGLGQGAVQEFTRVETGLQDEYTGGRTLAQGLGSAIGAGLINVPVGMGQKLFADRASELAAKADLAEVELAKTASRKSKEVLAKAGKDKENKAKQILNALNPNDVAVGRKLKKDMSSSESLTSALGPEVVDNIAAAFIRVSDEIELKPGQRITEAISDGIRNKTIDMSEVGNILREHNLNLDQFGLVYLAELSDAGRILGTAGNLQKELAKQKVDLLVRNLDDLNRGGFVAMTGKEAQELADANDVAAVSNKFMQGARDLDRLGVASMTVQAATTMRNTIGGGFRGAIDATTRTMDNAIEIATGNKAPKDIFSGSFDMLGYTLNPYESRVVRTLFEKEFPEEAKRLFRDNADIDYRGGREKIQRDKAGNIIEKKDADGNVIPQKQPAMNKLAKNINVFNTMSDNMFKQTVLATSLSRAMKDSGTDIASVIASGNFKNIPQEVYQKAIKDAYEFTYQSNLKGKDDKVFGMFASAGNVMQEVFPFVFSAFMPFPKFVANQLKFQYDHIPLLGFTDALVTGSGKRAREQLPKQLAGASALTAAYAWRVQQGPNAEWYEIDKGNGDYINGKAIYGPLAPFMVAADVLYRTKLFGFGEDAGQEVPQEWGKYYSKAMLEATLGSTFRTGLGLAGIETLYDSTVSNVSAKGIAEWAGNTIGRYTIGVGVAKDIYSQFDEASRMVPATSTGEEDFFDIVGKVSTRNLPDIPQIGGYDTPARSPYMSGPLMSINPIEKQLFGSTTTRKSPLMKEMSRLGMSYNDIYERDKDDKIDFYTRQELSREGSKYNLNVGLRNYMDSDLYAKADSAEEKVTFLKEIGRGLISEAKSIAKLRIRQEAKRQGLPYSKVELAEWDSQSQTVRDRIDKIYDEEFGNGDGTSTVLKDKDRTLYIGDRRINVMVWATSAIANLPKAGEIQ